MCIQYNFSPFLFFGFVQFVPRRYLQFLLTCKKLPFSILGTTLSAKRQSQKVPEGKIEYNDIFWDWNSICEGKGVKQPSMVIYHIRGAPTCVLCIHWLVSQLTIAFVSVAKLFPSLCISHQINSYSSSQSSKLIHTLHQNHQNKFYSSL